MTDSMVERVARALHAMHGLKSPYEPYADVYRDQARAAIAAMREPTEAMCDQAWEHMGTPEWAEKPAQVWQAMIDEALK